MTPAVNNEVTLPAESGWHWVGLAIKIILTGVAVWMFSLLLQMMMLGSVLNPLAGDSRSPAKSAAPARKSPSLPAPDPTFWPHPPGCFGRGVHQLTINGVDTVGEDWQTALPAADVIAFYKEQMLARGWRDVTEQNYQLQPESRNDSWDKNGVQNPDFVKRYSDMVDSSLVLNHNQWSVQIKAVSGGKGIHPTSVQMFAAATPALREFCMSIGAGAFRGDGVSPVKGAIDTVQESAGQVCHTTISIKQDEASEVFNRMLKEYHANNWRSMTLRADANGSSGYFAWLSRGQSYAGLAVKALPHGKTSTVTITEVSPK
jgi:hypothetical protein